MFSTTAQPFSQKRPIPIVQEAGWALGVLRMGMENPPPPRTVHPEASHCFDYTILASTVYISHYMYGGSVKLSCYTREI